MRKLGIFAFAIILGLALVHMAAAIAPTCAITGNLVHLYGSAAKSTRVYFSYSGPQNAGGSIVQGENVSVLTDSNGNLPTSGGCLPSPGTQFCPSQGAYFYVQVGTGRSIKVQAPLMSTVDLDTLILANTDPTSIVTNIASGNSGCSVVNPSTGVAGTATITCTQTSISPYVGPVGITGNQGNGTDFIANVNVNGTIFATSEGMKVANTDNSTNLQNAINAAYETGTSSATRGKVEITPDSTGGTTYNFANGVDFKNVPVECVAGRSSGNSAGTFNITLNFTFTTGIAIEHAGTFKNCRVTGGFTVGSGLSATISSIVDGTNNQATVTTSASNTAIAGGHVIISGTTNYNGVYPVASITDNTHFVISTGKAGLGSEATGTVNYYPTVGVMAHSPTTGLTAGGVDWENLMVQGFGTDYNLSGLQSGAGSVNDWVFANSYAGIAPVGVLANGNGFPVGGINSNVSGGRLQTLTCVNVAICVYGGPMVNYTSNINDTEEDSFGDNDVSKVDFESQDSNSADSIYVAGLWIGSYGNNIHDNYTSVGSSPGSGQTAKGSIRTVDDTGPNWVNNNRVTSQALGLVLNTAVDEALLNIPGVSANQSEGRAFLSGISLAAKGQTPNPVAAACKGTCATAGGGGTVNSYALVGIGWDGNKSTLSANFICPDGSYTTSGVACGAGVTGPNPYSGTNFVTMCWNPDPNYKAYDIYINDNAHYTHLAFASGSNGNNCFSDTSGSSTSTTAPANDTTGGINETNTHATNILGAQIQMTAVAIGSLPSTCTAGTGIPVTNWTGTVGTCSGNSGGTDYTIATCGASNTWYCP